MRTAITLALLCISTLVFSQVNRIDYAKSPKATNSDAIRQSPNLKIKWEGIKKQQLTEILEIDYLSFEGAIYTETSKAIPVYMERQVLAGDVSRIKAQLENAVYAEFTDIDISQLDGADQIGNEIKLDAQISVERKVPYAQVSLIPIRKNALSGQFEKLISFDIRVIPTEFGGGFGSPKSSNAAHSVLASGNWYKVAVNKNAVYKIDYAFLQSLGINVAGINPKNLRIYGNGGGMLPQANSAFRHDDLTENAIYVSGENDGSFDQGDYILFYGESPDQWQYDANSCGNFKHIKNIYSDYTYYFITADLGVGKRISSRASSSQSATHSVNTFDDFAFHESDEVNFIKSGKQWYGELFDLTTNYTFGFNFPNIDGSSPVSVKVDVAGKYTSPTSFSMSVNGTSQPNINIPAGSGSYTDDFAKLASSCNSLNIGTSAINVTLNYLKGSSDAKGWLNYIEVIARRKLTLSGNQMAFRDAQSVGLGNVVEYTINNATGISVWDITDPTDIKSQQLQPSGNTAAFKFEADELHEFIAFNGGYETPIASGSVANQDLHGLQNADMFIVCHPDFISQAQRLADFHRNKDEDELDVVIVEPQQIYNEFSSGAQDVSAIRDFMKMFYDRATTADDIPRYLLLFGDPSYDYKNRISGNTNFVPTYQSENSVSPTTSYPSDDFFGLLDDNEGVWAPSDADALDIGIGRFPVSTLEFATGIVNKILGYEGIGGNVDPNATGEMCAGQTVSIAAADWRNIICFIGDDEDSNLHVSQSNALATIVDTTYRDYNIDKIFLDAYPQESTPGGQRYQGATDAINNRVEKGALIINYTGHGGEVGWAHERVLQLSDINGWANNYRLPAFITATCEFSRFDDPERISAGEYVLLNPNGGGIALFTTTRLVYSAPNFTLNKNFYNHVFNEVDGHIPSMGDVIRKTKVASGSGVNNRNFSLLGDPAQKLAYPVHDVVTTEINNKPVSSGMDTLGALSLVTVKGEIHNRDGGKMTDFSGTLYPTVFDKKSIVTTLGNDPSSNPMNFSLQKNVLYKGKVSVTNGDFSFTFVVPKDIAYNYGIGRISYYAENGITNANGYYENLIIGGSSNNASTDDKGPEVSLYLNDDNFVFGGITNENPLLYAIVSDQNGINTVGNGIGHDITAVLDDNTTNSFVLNDYYEADLDSYQSGKVNYPFSDLAEGRHTLKFKVWDVYNNSAESYTEFVVAKSADLALDHVLNYPNPFTTHTEFHFEHNQPCDLLNVNIQVFTISGKLVKTLNETIHSEGFRAEPVAWDGRDDYGQKIARGVYVYHIKVRTENGDVADAYERLVILN